MFFFSNLLKTLGPVGMTVFLFKEKEKVTVNYLCPKRGNHSRNATGWKAVILFYLVWFKLYFIRYEYTLVTYVQCHVRQDLTVAWSLYWSHFLWFNIKHTVYIMVGTRIKGFSQTNIPIFMHEIELREREREREREEEKRERSSIEIAVKL